MKILMQVLALSVICALLGLGLAERTAQAASASADAVTPAVDPLQRPALFALRASRAVTLAIVSAGRRSVAAGERGIVLWSDDDKTWQQAKVPVSVTLTALSFPTPQQGWAVGHGGLVLHSADGGQNWARQLDGRAAAQIELKAAQAPLPRKKSA